jgi:hypothetical protein
MKSHRIVTVAGTVLFGALLLGAPQAAAATAPPPAKPTEIVVTAANPKPRLPEIGTPPSETDPQPCQEICEPECPEGQLCENPGEPCETGCEPAEEPEDPPAERPGDPDQPADEPGDDPAGEPTDDPTGPSPTAKPVDQPRSAPAGVPTPTRIDTGEGPGGGRVNWWLIAVPVFALLTIAAGAAHFWIGRTERAGK